MLLFMDSFDHYLTADAQGKFWILTGGMGIGSLGGRHTTNSIHAAAAGDTAIRPIGGATGTTVIVGVAVKSPLGGGANCLLSIWDGGNAVNQVFLQLNPSDGTISAWRGAATSVGVGNITGATLLGTSAPAIIANVYAYLECRVVLSDTVGQVEVRVNGTQVLLLTGIDTVASAAPSPFWTGIALGTSGASTVVPVPVDWDDLYVCDGSGAAPWNAFLGDCRVDRRIPTGPGSSTQWTGTPGLNWQNVKDVTPNGDTDYNTGLAGQTDLFDMEDVVAPGVAIFGIQHNLSFKKLDNGLCTIVPTIRHAGNNYSGAGLTPTTNYTYGVQVAATNPATGVAWTETDFNAAQFGYRRSV